MAIARRRSALGARSTLAVALLLASAGHASADGLPCSGDPMTVEKFNLTNDASGYGFYALPSSDPRGLVVFAHGYTYTADAWRERLMDAASRDGVIAVAMNYRGTRLLAPNPGETFPRSRGWRVAEGAEDSIGAARLFEAGCDLGGKPIVIYGVSMGGNAAGLTAAAGATRSDGSPLFDYVFLIEAATNVSEVYHEAGVVALSGNQFAEEVIEDIEEEMGGTFMERPDIYLERSVVTRAEDIALAGVRGAVLVHAVNDGLVGYNQTREMAARLRQVGVAADVFTVATRGSDPDPGATIDGYVFGTGTGYPYLLAGHGSEVSTTHIVPATGFERLTALLSRGEAPRCYREFVVDGMTGVTAPDPAATGDLSC